MVALILSGCVSIKNHEFCADFGEDGAHCANFLSTETRDLTKPEWDLERENNMVCEKTEVFADWKSVIEKLCSESKRCKYEDIQSLKTFGLRLDRLAHEQRLRRQE